MTTPQPIPRPCQTCTGTGLFAHDLDLPIYPGACATCGGTGQAPKPQPKAQAAR